MNITCLHPGKTKSSWAADAINIYNERISHYTAYEWRELADNRIRKQTNTGLRKKEEAALLNKQIPQNTHLVLLDEKGKNLTSKELAAYLEKMQLASTSSLTFITGGPFGFDQSLYDAAHAKISLSRLTFPHELARVILAEQLYRAFSIINNQSYHHE
jgi:23S rRNA (pseudouridine1915-N3)-methyltransferase